MRPQTELSPIHGVWTVNNPDRGEVLTEPTARMVIGGTLLLDTEGGTALASLTLRNGSGESELERAAGRVRRNADGTIELRLTDGSYVIFAQEDDGRLVRLAQSRTTIESGLSLSKTADAVPDSAVEQHRVPGILLNTMPKSGSIFISRALSEGLAIPETKIAVCLFPDDLVLRDRLDDLALGNTIVQQHIPARDINLRFLRHRLDRMIVHVRDPRQATLSWLHHLDNFHAHRDVEPACALGLEATTPALPDDYFDRDQAARLDYLLETHLPQLVEWTRQWADAADAAAGPEILMTTYEEFVANPSGFLARLLAFYRIPQAQFDRSRLPAKTAQTHFRKGQPDEWKSVYSAAQKETAASAISEDLAKRFGWELD